MWQDKGKLNRKEGEKLVHDVVQKYQTAGRKYGKDLQSHIDSVMEESIKASPFATKKDIDDINRKLDRIADLSNKSAAKSQGRKKARRRV